MAFDDLFNVVMPHNDPDVCTVWNVLDTQLLELLLCSIQRQTQLKGVQTKAMWMIKQSDRQQQAALQTYCNGLHSCVSMSAENYPHISKGVCHCQGTC